jgi:rhodanese-related sulfurtransferase
MGALCILAAILRLWNLPMLAQLIEFATNHYALTGCFVVLAVLLLVTELRKGGQSLSSRELTALVNRDAGVVLDIRNSKDFSAGHIVDALNIPFDKVASRIAELEKHKAKTIIVVDAMGQHAGSVARDLKKAGFTAAKLGGGIASWRSDNLPVVK